MKRNGAAVPADMPTLDQLKAESAREKHKNRFSRAVRNTIFTLITVSAAAVLIAVLLLPVLRIYGTSMSPTLSEGDIVVSVKSSSFETGEIVAFYYNNKILVKRVIAHAGDWVNIDKDGTYSTTAPDPVPQDTYVLVHFTKITTKSAIVDCDGTTGPDGQTNFTGLSAGTYTLTEIESPDGYNLLDEPIEFGINWSPSKGFTVAANDHNGITFDHTTGTFNITVENNKGSVLPNTGGIGTTIFMIVGGILILGAAVVLVSVLVSRRKENN